MRNYLTYLILPLAIFFSGCSDNWETDRQENKLTKHEWTLHMYVDGVENEIVGMVPTVYVFNEGGEFIQRRNEDQEVDSSWELLDEEYIRIASSVFKIRTLTNRILTLEFGQDVLYFIPVD